MSTGLCYNTAPPYHLFWNNVSLAAAPGAVYRGFSFGVGTPKQTIVIKPYTNQDNTEITNNVYCSWQNYYSQCVTLEGGTFDASKSATYTNATQAAWNGTHTSYSDSGGSFYFFNDQLTFSGSTSNGTVNQYPFFMATNSSGPGALPLGLNSDFVQALVTTGQAPSRHWGLWPGSSSIDKPVGGELTIGGYTSNRVNGQFTEFDSSAECQTCVTIQNFTYEFNGTSRSFFRPGQVMTVSLQPGYGGIELLSDIFATFINITGGVFDTSLGYIRYPATQQFGSLKVVLQNGFTTTIAPEEVFQMPRWYLTSGAYAIANNTIKRALATNYTPSNYLPDWGLPFLTMNYLVMDPEAKKFRMAAANREPYGSGQGYLDAKLCSGLATTTPSPIPSPTTSIVPSGTSSNPPTSSSAAPSGGGSSTGAIVGGVVGGVGAIAIIAFLAWFLLRRKRKEKQNAELAAQQSQQGPGGGPQMGQYPYSPQQQYPQSPQSPQYNQPTPYGYNQQGYAPYGAGVVPVKDSRYSTYTHETSEPTDPSELASQGAHENEPTRFSQLPTHDERMSPTMNAPFEMPVHRY